MIIIYRIKVPHLRRRDDLSYPSYPLTPNNLKQEYLNVEHMRVLHGNIVKFCRLQIVQP
jgi:hypothetical protein